jgi:hypothetical protein
LSLWTGKNKRGLHHSPAAAVAETVQQSTVVETHHLEALVDKGQCAEMRLGKVRKAGLDMHVAGAVAGGNLLQCTPASDLLGYMVTPDDIHTKVVDYIETSRCLCSYLFKRFKRIRYVMNQLDTTSLQCQP